MEPRFVIAAALAAAALLPTPGQANDSVLTLYGIVAPIVESVGGDGAAGAPPRRLRMGSNISHLGVRGREGLGGGWSAIFQLETGFPVDDVRVFGFPDRNSAVGLEGPAGRLLLGQWDTPFKASTIAYGPMRIGLTQDFPTIMSNPGYGVPPLTTQSTRVGGKADAAFDRRQGNSVQYWTPVLAGVQARLAYSTDEGRGAAAPGGPVVRPRVFGASVAWGPLGRQVGAAWERHDDYFGLSQLVGSAAATDTNPSSRDQAFKVFGEVKVGPVRLAAFADRLEYRNRDAAPGAVDRYERDAINVLVQPILGPHRPWVAWTRARAGSCTRVGGLSCDTAGRGAEQWVAGWLYAFSRRTEAYVVAQRLENGTSGTYGLLPPLGAPLAGARYTGWGIGMTHYF